ncbi:ABC transporter permease [Xanthovirga aplysinae]|uniref:ABC transporter permease n=1 Tax=Xanthovirga aplysinae TaxID=2529853 RepID=UPI0012BD6B4D|nr:ABC transporter permease [Xanthovirga aplysinae]MTI31621.1 ABC transporter permease [Xanthovirga aplysinae]
MRQFLIFAQMEFYHIFRDRWTAIMLLALPVLMIILFGFGISTEIKNSKVAVYDPSQDVATQTIVDNLAANAYFDLETYVNTPKEIETIFQKSDIGLLVVFSENFYENLLHTGEAQVQLITDGTDPNTASTLVSYATSIIEEYQAELLGNDKGPTYQISPITKLLYNPNLTAVYNIVPGVLGLVLILICTMMTSVSIAREKELGTMEVLLVSPISPLLIVLSKIAPYFLISVVDLISLLVISVFLMGVPINGSFFVLTCLSLLFILLALSLGLLISTIAESQMSALLMSAMGLIMPVSLLSGLMFPIENMPLLLQVLAQFVPAKWYIDALRDVMIKGLGFSSIILEVSILLGMLVVLVLTSLRNFKVRLE